MAGISSASASAQVPAATRPSSPNPLQINGSEINVIAAMPAALRTCPR
jgi:hypothetical protein